MIAAPPQIPRRGYGSLIQIATTVLGSLGIVAFAFIMPSKAFLIISGVLVLISILSALGNQFAQRRSGQQSAKTLRRLYRRHLAERTLLLKDLHVRQRTLDERLYPDAAGLATAAAHRQNLWERRPWDRDFLQLRFGRAAVALACGVQLSLSDDPMVEYEPDLLEDARALTQTFSRVSDLSVVESLSSASVVTLGGPRDPALALVRSLIVQLATFRAPTELRLMAAFEPAEAEEWSWCKWLPHARAAGRGNGTPTLLLAAGAQQLEGLLDAQVQPRVEQLRRIQSSSTEADAGIDAPELIIVIDGYHAGGEFARLPLMREIATHGPKLKVRTICLVEPGAAEPPESTLRLVLSADGGELTVERTGASGYRIGPVLPDQLTGANADRIARALAPLSLQESAANIDLAADVRLDSLLDLPRGELCGPLGVADDGTPVILDLKQAALGGMGPHGLLVGATGSGKSELLRTFVASLSQRQTPEELAFVMIDFKGGAAFADLATLPHAAGLITNLQQDLTLIDRVQEALFGEIARRQALLRDAGNLDDVSTYQARRSAHPEWPALPHLVVIVDEFGELLANRPEFLDLFLTIGRVGRSLGIHLLLSSQRLEEGRLKGLESHLRYRLCLRTYSAAESKTVLGAPDAFLLPPHPGVGFLSVDTDIFVRFKTALVSAPAIPEGGESLGRGFVGAFSLPAGSGEDKVADPAGPLHATDTDLDVLVRRMRERYAGTEVHQVWLKPLASKLALSRIWAPTPWWDPEAQPTAHGLEACVGLADLPGQQRQDPLRLDLSGGGGHVALIGSPQTGKSTALRTILLSLLLSYTPDQVRAYVLDFGGGLLHSLAEAPHIGDVAGRGDPERTVGIVRHMRGLLTERERRYRELGLESIVEARARAHAGELDPELASDVVLVIDGWAGLTRDHERLVPEILEITASGLHHGIHVILSTGRWAELRANLRDSFGTRLELRLNDPVESDFGRRVAELIPAGIPGRGITPEGVLFQVALPRQDDVDSTEGLTATLNEIAAGLDRRWTGARPKAIGILPETVTAADLDDAVRRAAEAAVERDSPQASGAPVGLTELTLDPAALDINLHDGHVLILGEPGSGRTEALRTAAQALGARYEEDGVQTMVVDLRRNLADLRLSGAVSYVARPPEITAAMEELRAECVERINAEAPDRSPIIVLVDDYDLIAGVGSNPLAPLGDIIFQGRDSHIHVVLARTTINSARLGTDPVIARMLEAGASALLLSGDPNEGPLVRGIRAQPLPAGRAIVVRRRGQPALIQLALMNAVAADRAEMIHQATPPTATPLRVTQP